MTILYLTTSTLLIYSALIAYFYIGIMRINKHQTKTSRVATNKIYFSIIIALRNEEENTAQLLESLKRINYSPTNFEILFINDHSTDNTLNQLKILSSQLSNSTVLNCDYEGKKAAIKYGVNHSKGDYIITTDADCSFNPEWLNTINNHLNNCPVDMLCGPVEMISNENNLLHYFQKTEFMSLQLCGAGAIAMKHPIMNNGANLIIKRDRYLYLSRSIKEEYLSGDDIFLLHEAISSQQAIDFLWHPNAIVRTPSQPSWKALFQQRIRWSSKSTGYQDGFTIIVACLVFLSNCAVLGSLFTLNIYFIFGTLIGKHCIDTLLLLKGKRFFKHSILSSFHYFTQIIIYPLYILISAFGGLFSNTWWKERKVKR